MTPAAGETPCSRADHRCPTYDTGTGAGQPTARLRAPDDVSMTESSTTSSNGFGPSPPRTTTTRRATTTTAGWSPLPTRSAPRRPRGTTTATASSSARPPPGRDGSQAQLVNTLTADGTNIETSTTSVGKVGGTLSARQTLTYGYDHGQLTSRTLAWAAGAQPAPIPVLGRRRARRDRHHVRPLGRPRRGDRVAHHHRGRRNVGRPGVHRHRRPGVRPGGQRPPTPMGRITTMAYDALGRRTRLTTPAGMVTTTAYSPTPTTVTGPGRAGDPHHGRRARSHGLGHRQRRERLAQRRSGRPHAVQPRATAPTARR